MSVYRKPGSRFFWYTFVFKGRRIQRSTKVENKREAENIERAAWTQLARGEVGIEDKPKADRKTISQLLDALENDFKARKKDNRKNLNLIGTVREELGDRWADTFSTAGATDYVSRPKEGAELESEGPPIEVSGKFDDQAPASDPGTRL